MKKILLICISLLFLISPIDIAQARELEDIDDWYIKDFKTEIVVNPDTSVTITEWIVADCGNLPDKHGIYRVLPTFYQETFWRRIQTPITLHSITDFSGKYHPFTVINNPDSITWKIGNPNRTVQNEQQYKIKYTVQNAVRTRNASFDELYWNLNGNFWDIETDAFEATIQFPLGINQSNSNTYYYFGQFGEKRQENVSMHWLDDQTLKVQALGMMRVGEGITLSTTFPKGIMTALPLSLWNQYQQWTIYLLPLVVLLFCFSLWYRVGKDINLKKAIVPEYAPPAGYDVLELAMIYHNAKFSNKFISAAIMDLAARKVIQIKDIVLSHDDKMVDCTFVFQKNDQTLTAREQLIIKGIFDTDTPLSGSTATLSSLKDRFYTSIPDIIVGTKDALKEKGIFTAEGMQMTLKLALTATGGIFLEVLLVVIGLIDTAEQGLVIFSCFVILLIFSQFMAKLTTKGYELKRHLKGFCLFMNTAEKHRQMFLEKSFLFEQMLPFAVIFGLVKKWVTAAKKIYANTDTNQASIYWGGAMPIATINSSDAFTSALSSFSSNMTSTMSSSPSSSGSSGSGSSGGGGGGGGGGGW